MPEIDPTRTPLTADDLAREAERSGDDAQAPPLTEAGKADRAVERVESDITLLPPG